MLWETVEMAGFELAIISLYMYLVGRALTLATQETRTEAEATRRLWGLEAQRVDLEISRYKEKRKIEKTMESESGLELAGTLSGGVAAPSTPEEDPGKARDEPERRQAKKGIVQGLMSKVTSLYPFVKSKND